MKDVALAGGNENVAVSRGSSQEFWNESENLFRRPSFSGQNYADSETNLLYFDIA